MSSLILFLLVSQYFVEDGRYAVLVCLLHTKHKILKHLGLLNEWMDLLMVQGLLFYSQINPV